MSFDAKTPNGLSFSVWYRTRLALWNVFHGRSALPFDKHQVFALNSIMGLTFPCQQREMEREWLGYVLFAFWSIFFCSALARGEEAEIYCLNYKFAREHLGL